VMLYAAIDIHKHAFQAAVLDPEGGEVVEASSFNDAIDVTPDEQAGRHAIRSQQLPPLRPRECVWRLVSPTCSSQLASEASLLRSSSTTLLRKAS
jgi:hypothetical protein